MVLKEKGTQCQLIGSSTLVPMDAREFYAQIDKADKVLKERGSNPPLKKNTIYKFFKGFTISQKKTFVKGFIKKFLRGLKPC